MEIISCIGQCHRIENLRLQKLRFHGEPSNIYTKKCIVRHHDKNISVNKNGYFSSNIRRSALRCKADGDLLEITGRRRSANYEPSVWADYFATYAPPKKEPQEWMERNITELKKEVGEMIRSTTDIVDMMNLVDAIQRLGIGYHFVEEINDALIYLHDTELVDNEEDLEHVALRFRLLRQHGFYASSDVFCKFKDSTTGNFDEKSCHDAKALLSLYNAGYLAFPGEIILDEAISFARHHLQSNVDDLNPPLKRQVLRELETPLHRNVPRIEAMFYIEEYEEEEEKRNEALLKLAKLDYNLVSRLHLEELKNLTIWWKESNIAENYEYGRNRIVENYFWAVALYYEPQYARARAMITKYYALQAIVDDTFDIYGTYEECKLLNCAFQRWDENAIDCLPMYLRELYLKFITTVNGFMDELEPSEQYRVSYLIEETKAMINGYMQEVEWEAKRQVPTFNKREKPAIHSYIGTIVVCGPLVGMGEEVSEGALRWLNSLPDIAVEPMKICRYTDDVVSFEREKTGGQRRTSIMCYMIEHSVTRDEAVAKFQSLAEESWKRLNRARFLSANVVPVPLLDRMVNYARMSDAQHIRGFSYCSKSKELYGMLFRKQFPL